MRGRKIPDRMKNMEGKKLDRMKSMNGM